MKNKKLFCVIFLLSTVLWFAASAAASESSAAIVRIKAGAYEPFTDSNGNVWQADQGFEGGATIDRYPEMEIDGTRDPELFLSEHYAMDSFSCKIPNGRYIAKLYFAETFEGIYDPGERVFSFNVQGHEFKDFDIWAKAGGPERAYIETVPVEVTNGEFRIVFTTQIENPAINAIEIIPQPAEVSAPSEAIVRIKAGAYEPFTDSNGNVWQADQDFEGGATIDRDPEMDIDGTRDPELFLSEHYAMDSFSCKIPNGRYIAKLYFAETFEGIYDPGERVFSFNVQGHEFKDFDIWAKAGGPERAYIETVPVEVTNGEFRIVFTTQIENPAINAIEIIPQTTATDSAPADSQDKSALKDVYKKYFLIGGAYNRNVVTGRDPNAAEIAIKHFNTATSENDMKWQSVHPRLGQYTWEAADNFIEFCEKNNMFPIGHTLVWHGQTPRSVFQDDSGNAVTRDELLARMKEHITTVVGRYKGRVKGWDVANEALNDNGTVRHTQWARIIGEGKPEQQYDHIVKAFEYAHEADPNAELYYNDYSLDTSRSKCDGAVKIVKLLQSKGLRIDGVGIQLHAGLSYPTVEALEYAITTLAATGVKVMVTELDVRTRTRGYRGADISRINREGTSDANAESEQTQQRLAEKYAELFSVFLKHKKDISRVTFWGVYDRTSWIGGSPLLFDRDYQPKQCFDAVIKVVQDNK